MPCALELVTADAPDEVELEDDLLVVVDAAVEAPLVEAVEFENGDPVEVLLEVTVTAAVEDVLVDAGAADELDDTGAELDVVEPTAAVAAQEQTAIAAVCTANAELPHAERTQVIAAA
jgi:hypothetical protein